MGLGLGEQQRGTKYPEIVSIFLVTCLPGLGKQKKGVLFVNVVRPAFWVMNGLPAEPGVEPGAELRAESKALTFRWAMEPVAY